MNVGNAQFPTASSSEGDSAVMLNSTIEQNVTNDVQTTRFDDSTLMENEFYSSPSSVMTRLDSNHSIVNFLERPTEILETFLTPSNMGASRLRVTQTSDYVTNSPLLTIALPHDVLKKGRKIDKLQNFEWLKCDVTLKFVTNANPFVAGRLWICYAPHDDIVVGNFSVLHKGGSAVTSYPGVELDLQQSTSCELTIPWCSRFDAMSLTDSSYGPYCKVYVFPLTELLAGDTTSSVPLRVFGWLSNVTLRGPTYRDVNLQGGEAKGPITEIASSVSKSAAMLSKVPVIGEVASTVSWISNLVSGVASVFGWSAPVTGEPNVSISNIPARGFSHVKATNNAVILGASNENNLPPGDHFFTKDDEMQIEYVCNRPALIKVVPWGVNVPLITNCRVGPLPDATRIHNSTTASANYATFSYTPFEYVANLFHMWRADIHFRVSVVRTAFHVGRLEVVFIPGTFVVPPNNADYTNCWRHVLDVTENSDLEFVIPYQHTNIMCKNRVGPLRGERANEYSSIGTLVIRQLTPLTCPSTVSDTVQVMIWKWATNVTLAAPMTTGTTIPVNFQSDDVYYDCEEEGRTSADVNTITVSRPTTHVLQGVLANESGDQIRQVAFGATNNTDDALKAITSVAGESITSLRALTRAHRWHTSGVKAGLNSTLPNSKDGGLIGLVSALYAFWRGGLSYKLVCKDGTWVKASVVATDLEQAIRNSSVPVTAQAVALNPIVEVQVPYYCSTRRMVTNEISETDDDRSRKLPMLLVDTDCTKMETYWAGKDDFDMGFLVGPPLVYQTLTKPTLTINDDETT